MIRIAKFVVFAACLLAALRSTAMAGVPRYSITQLHQIAVAAGVYASANAINDNGVVVGSESAYKVGGTGYRIDWTKTRPLAWDLGASPSTLPTIAGMGGIAKGVNNNGIVVGESGSDTTTTPGRATIFRSTEAGQLFPNSPNSMYSIAGKVNGTGTILASLGGVPTLVDAATGALTQLNLGSGTPPSGAAINDQGIVLGASFGSSIKPVRLSTTAAPVPLYTGNRYGYVDDLNNSNVAVGGYAPSGGAASPAIFMNGTVTTFGLGLLVNGEARAINDRGDIVGIAGSDYFAAADGTPFLSRDNVATDLRTLIVGVTLPIGFAPIDINDRGQIIGNATIDDDNNASTPKVGIAFRLDPVRTPGDTNYDDVVNFTDLVTLAQNYGHAGNGNVFWESGDFDFDWQVGFSDLVLLAQNYQSAASFDADWALAQSLVPEPGTGALLAVLAGSAMARRNRR